LDARRFALQVRYNDVVTYDEVDNIINPIAESVPSNRQFVLGLRLKRLKHKLYGVRYHLDNFKKAEDEEIAALTANHVGTDHDAVSNNPKIIYEVEAFLFQVEYVRCFGTDYCYGLSSKRNSHL
jgi:hypothetical protein